MKWLLGPLLCVVALGCGRTGTQGHAAAAAGTSGHEHGHGCSCARDCPMKVDGVQAVYEDADGGAAIVFTTEKGEVKDVQAGVAGMVARHNEPAKAAAEGHIAHRARADNVQHGARLVLTPSDPGKLDALRTHVREHVAGMQSSACPMMHEHGGEPAHPASHGKAERGQDKAPPPG